jgi:hypothetical protein
MCSPTHRVSVASTMRIIGLTRDDAVAHLQRVIAASGRQPADLPRAGEGEVHADRLTTEGKRKEVMSRSPSATSGFCNATSIAPQKRSTVWPGHGALSTRIAGPSRHGLFFGIAFRSIQVSAFRCIPAGWAGVVPVVGAWTDRCEGDHDSTTLADGEANETSGRSCRWRDDEPGRRRASTPVF